MSRIVRRVESIVPRRAREFGGKARNLAALARGGFPVPAAWAVPGTVCRDHLQRALPPDERLERLLARGASVSASRLAAIAEKVRQAPLAAEVEKELREVFAEMQRAGVESIVVRSSSTREDRASASAAGIHDTVLNVRTEAALLDAVRACWASLFQPRALAYLVYRADAADASMGVVIQAMVPADVSGVVFTVNPLTGDAGELVINASYGLGVSVVDGRVSPDTYRVDKASGSLRDRVLGDKSLRSFVDDNGSVCEEDVPEAQRSVTALDEATVSDLASIGLRVESHLGGPQDIEFAVARGTIYLLQARPVTTGVPTSSRRTRRRTPVDRSRIVWSNVNVGEALPGVATPLTWSILSNFSELGFRRAFGSLGCSVPRDAELVGSFRGRIYLNLTEFVQIISQVPGLRPRTLLSLGGGGEVDRLEAELDARSKFGFFARLPMTATRFARENFRITERVADFEESFEEERARYAGMDLAVLGPQSLSKTLRDVEELLDYSGTIMLTAYGNLLASLITLRTILSFIAKDRAEGLLRDLLTGLADVESAAPGLRLWHIAETARTEVEVKRILLEEDLTTLKVESLPEGPTRRALTNFLTAFGFRGPREAEIATPRWREDPTLLFVTLRAHLRGGGDPPIEAERRLREVRDRAHAELDRLLPGPALVAVRHLLTLVSRFTRLRERLRSHVTAVLGMFRDVALDASRRFALREPACGADAAFFLTSEELHAVLRGDSRAVATRVKQRRRQYDRDRALPDPPDTFVGYPPEVPAPLPDTDALTGLGASSGRVTGIARVLTTAADAAELRAGEIIVAPYADVGWSPLFTVAAAVVTDLGGPLSHASVVAREYGVPSVVNVKVGTRMIKTGDRLDVDGDAGIVKILEHASS